MTRYKYRSEESMTVRFSRGLSELADLSTLNDRFAKILLEEGFNRWAYVSFCSKGTPYIASNYPKLWVARYEEQRYLSIDLIIAESTSATTPYLWKDVVGRIDNRRQWEFFSEAKEFNLASGIGIPTWGSHGRPGLVSLPAGEMGDGDFEQYVKTTGIDILAMTNLFHVYAQRFLQAEAQDQCDSIKLTRRERQCLDLLILGNSNSQIAEDLGISSRVVSFHVENIKEKYQVGTRLQLLARVLQASR